MADKCSDALIMDNFSMMPDISTEVTEVHSDSTPLVCGVVYSLGLACALRCACVS